MENLIEELTKVNPSNLSEEGLKLFNKINEIIDRNKELEEANEDLNDLYWNKCIPNVLIKEKIEELKHKDFIAVQVCCQHDNKALAQIQVLEELLKGR